MLFYNIMFYLAAIGCLGGFGWRIWQALRFKVQLDPAKDAKQRKQGKQGVSKKVLFKAFFKDVLLLSRVWKLSKARWFTHMALAWSFIALVFFHALGRFTTGNLFSGYEPTLDPWQWLRNLWGLVVFSGLIFFIGRRLFLPRLRKFSRGKDWFFLFVITGIILSGFFLEAGKIQSPAVFQRMVEDYSMVEEPEEFAALQAYWEKEYGMIFETPQSRNPEMLAFGKELHEESCVSCHSNTVSAFVSRPLSAAMAPLAPVLRQIDAHEVFFYLHIFLVFLALALFPYGKFFHPVSTTLSLLAAARKAAQKSVKKAPEKSVEKPAKESAKAPVQKQEKELPSYLTLLGCMDCGECSSRCSMYPAFHVLGNDNILPANKLKTLLGLIRQGQLPDEALRSLAEGCRLCSLCKRCTSVCPAGLDLQTLWESAREALASSPVQAEEKVRKQPVIPLLADEREAFANCIQCTVCTNVCPIVALAENPRQELGLTPQQIMNTLRMGLKDKLGDTKMLWYCTTCYKCQEHCPHGVPVADIICELRTHGLSAQRAGKNGCCDDRLEKGENI